MTGQTRPSTVLPWATEANFPPGPFPWSGQPCTRTPSGDILLPGNLDARDLNYLFKTYSASAQAFQDWSGNGPALNWSPAFASTVFNASAVGQIQAVRWEGNPSIRQWLASVTYGSSAPASVAELWASADQGQTWTLAGGASLGSDGSGFLSQAACVDPNTAANYLAAVSFAGGAPVFQVNTAAFGGSWSNSYQDLTIQPTGLNVATSGATAIFSYVTGSAGALLSTNNSGTTWQKKTIAAATEWLVRASGATVQQVLAVPLRTPKSTVGALFAWDGATFTGTAPNLAPAWQAQALPTQMAGADEVLALTWATTPLGACWIMATAVAASGGSAAFYVSGDGETWFPLAFPRGLSIHAIQSGVTDLASVGGLLVATGDPGGSGTGPSRLYLSVDGGVTWIPSQSTLASNTINSGVGWSRPRLAASDFGFFAANTNWGRFSLCAGLPGVSY